MRLQDRKLIGKRHDALPEHVGNRLFGEVILRRAESAGCDDQIAVFVCVLNHLFEALRVIADGHVVHDIDSNLNHLLGQISGIRVENRAEQQFGSHTQDSALHSFASICVNGRRPFALKCKNMTIPVDVFNSG